MSEIKNGRLALYSAEHSKCNHMMTLGFKRLKRLRKTGSDCECADVTWRDAVDCSRHEPQQPEKLGGNRSKLISGAVNRVFRFTWFHSLDCAWL